MDLDCRAAGLKVGDCPDKMGYTIRVDKYRYTAWVPFNRSTATADWSKVLARELYNHSASPVPTSFDMERENIAEAAGSAAVVDSLHRRLVAFNLLEEAVASNTSTSQYGLQNKLPK